MARMNQAKIDQLIAMVAELKTDLAGLRTDFRAHDHGGTYAPTTIRIGASAGTISGTAEASSTTVLDVPTDMYK